MSGALAPLTTATAVTSWQFGPMVSAGLIVASVGYLAAMWRVHRRHPARPWPLRRALAFHCALLAIALATESSIGGYDDVLFSDHMVQHVLLIMVAPPLLVVGRPVTLALHATRRRAHSRLKRVVRSRALTVLTWPPGAALLYSAVVVGTHTAPFMDLVLANKAVLDTEHALYLVAGYLYFLPLIGSEPIRWRLSLFERFWLLLATMPVDIAVGVYFTLVSHEVFPGYARTGRTWGPSLVADLHVGGLIMFIGSDIVMSVIAYAIAGAFVYGRGHASVGWVERGRRAALLRDLARAGVAAPQRESQRGSAATIDDEAHLAAYNSYLEALSDSPRHRDDEPTTEGDGGDGPGAAHLRP